MKKCLFWLLFFLSNTSLTFSQQYFFHFYDTEQGLSHPQVTHILQDKNGSIWVSTALNGIGRFDGRKFINYSKKDGLLENVNHTFGLDKDGNIWVSHPDGLSKYDGMQFQSFKMPNCSRSDFVLDEQGNFWLLRNLFHQKAEVLLLKNGRFEDKTPDLFRDSTNIIQTIAKHPKKGIYLISAKNVYEFDEQHLIVADFSKQPDLQNKQLYPLVAKNGAIWLMEFETSQARVFRSVGKKVYLYKDGKLSLLPLPEGVVIRQLFEDSSQRLWLVTSLGLFWVKSDGSKNEDLHTLDQKNGVFNNEIYHIFEDIEKNIWFSPVGGLMLYPRNPFVRFTKKEGMVSDLVFNHFKDKDGMDWFGTRGGGVSRYDGKKMENFITHLSISSIVQKTDGSLWFGSRGGGLIQYKGGKFEDIGKEVGLPVEQITTMNRYGDSIYIGTPTGAYLYDGKKTEKILNNYTAWAIVRDKAKNTWFGTEKGLMCYTPAGEKKIYGLKEGLSYDKMGDITLDHNQHLWATTDVSVEHYDRKKFTQLNQKNYLSSEVVYSVVFRPPNQLWVGGKSGIDKLILGKNSEVLSVRSYKREDGLLGVPTRSFLDDDNTLWLGTSAGIYKYNEENDIANSQPVAVFLQNIKLFFREVNWQDSLYKDYYKELSAWHHIPQKLVLPYSKNHLTFEAEVLSYMKPEKILYSWKLEGIDDEWTPPSKEAKITYANLPADIYTLQIKACNSEGIWNKQPVSYTFEILPPLWQTWWFRLFLVGVLIGSVLFIIRLRIRNLEEQRKKLEGLVAERTQDVVNKNEALELQQQEIKKQNANLIELNEEVNKQKEELETQKDDLSEAYKEIEKKNKDITASITYAKRIQEAMLPFKDRIDQSLGANNFFILYQPRDIISGDFYFYEEVDNKVIIAIADCTGHGVPGAFMSMIGTQLLNEIILKNRITAPNEILNLLHKEIRRTLKQGENQSRDGMDIAMITLTKKETGIGFSQIEYAGAMNPLLVMQNNEMNTIDADKKPIGGYQKEDIRFFTKHTLSITAPLTLYLFSDGYADQFGGADKKKFMVKNFKNLLFEIHNLPMSQQEQTLMTTFEEWQGAEKQLDDVLVMGIQIS